jgi:hypothetical protein
VPDNFGKVCRFIQLQFILALWVRFYDFLPVALCVKNTILHCPNSFEGYFIMEKKTVALSAVTLAGAYLC